MSSAAPATAPVSFAFLKRLIASTGCYLVASKHRTQPASAETEKSHGEKATLEEATGFAGQLAAAETNLHVFVFDDDGAVVWQS